MHFPAFLEDRANYYEDLTSQWNEKYEREVKDLDEKICETKDIMISLRLKYDDLVYQFNLREEEIQDYLEEKKIKDDAASEAERKYEAIVKIQSWWKGIMVRALSVKATHFKHFLFQVRRGLGPYRRKKAKKGGKKKSGKKK